MTCNRKNECKRLRDIELIHGGDMVCSYCDEWRKECLERHYSAVMLMSLRGSYKRERWLDSYEKQFGKLGRVRLENEIAYRTAIDADTQEA